MKEHALTARYSTLAQALHWIIALTVLGMFVLGLSFDSVPRGTKTWWGNIHTVVGLVLFALVLFRLFWRVGHKPPPLPEGTSDLVRISSTAMHHVLYLFMVVIPIIGIVAYVWHARVFDFGLFKLDFHVANTKTIYEPAEDLHKYLVFTLMGLVGVHFLAALWHQFIKKDGLILRMLPGRD